MIPVQRIDSNITALADDEGSDRYRFNEDVVPNLNLAIKWVVAVANAALAQRKLSEESFRELMRMGVWQANAYARVRMNEAALNHKVWSIIAVVPLPSVIPANAVPNVINDALSLYRPDVGFDEGADSAIRQTREQWEKSRTNPFMPGNLILSGTKLKSYAYINWADYQNTSTYQPGGPEIEIRPRDVANKFVGIAYLKQPAQVSQLSDNIEFPETMEPLLTAKTWNYIANKQNDGTNVFSVTNKDIAELVSILL